MNKSKQSKQKQILNEDTRKTLKELIPLSNKFVLRNRTIFSDEYKQVICSVDLEQLGEDFEKPIYINDTSTFLSAVDLVDSPEITIKDRIINIKNDYQTINYITSGENSIDESKYSIIESTKKVNSLISFKLTSNLINDIKRAKSVLKEGIDTVFIEKTKDKLLLNLSINETFNAASNEFKIEIKEYEFDPDQGLETFVTKVPVDTFLKIPEIDYNFEVKYNKDKDSYRIYMCSESEGDTPLIELIASTIR